MDTHKIKILEKHCTVSRDGRIALSNTLVETAVKLYNCPIRVTCTDFPGEECILTVSDLTAAVPITGPHPDQYKPGNTYFLYYYIWKGVPINQKQEDTTEVESPVLESTVEKRGKKYVIKTPVVTTVIEEKEVSLNEYVGGVIYATRKAKGLSQAQLAIMTNNKISGNSISQIESALTNPILSSLEAIAEALDLHITDLFPPKA